jgi:hypothetical protein
MQQKSLFDSVENKEIPAEETTGINTEKIQAVSSYVLQARRKFSI